MRKIKSNSESGMALIYTLIAILILSLLATALLRSQRTAYVAHNQFLDSETGIDATDFCIQTSFAKLSNDALTNSFNVNPADIVTLTSSGQISAAFNNPNTSVTNTRISNSSRMLPSCSIQFIKQVQTVSTGSSTGQEISASRNYGAANGTTLKYYRVTAIQDTPLERIEYQIILAI